MDTIQHVEGDIAPVVPAVPVRICVEVANKLLKDGLNVGTLVSRTKLQYMFGLDPESVHNLDDAKDFNMAFTAHLESLQVHLLEKHKIHLATKRNTGNLVVVDPAVQIAVALKAAITSERRLNGKTKKVIQNVNTAGMSKDEYLQHSEDANRAGAYLATVKTARRSLVKAGKKKAFEPVTASFGMPVSATSTTVN